MLNKMLGMLSLCRRAGKVTAGSDAVREAIQERQAKLILLAADLSERSRSLIERAAEAGKVPCRGIKETMPEIAQVMGRETGILAILDSGFASGLERLISTEKEGE